MALQTCSDLKAALQYWCNNRDDIPDWSTDYITLVEGHMNMDLRCNEMLKKVTLTPVDGSVTLPDDFIGVYSVVENSAYPIALNPLSEDMAQQKLGAAGASPAISYTILGNSLDTFPPTSIDLTLVYYSAIPPLVNDPDTNWLLQKYPAIYLEGSQMEAYRALKMTEDLSVSSSRFNIMLDKITENEDFVMMSNASPPAGGGQVF